PPPDDARERIAKERCAARRGRDAGRQLATLFQCERTICAQRRRSIRPTSRRHANLPTRQRPTRSCIDTRDCPDQNPRRRRMRIHLISPTHYLPDGSLHKTTRYWTSGTTLPYLKELTPPPHEVSFTDELMHDLDVARIEREADVVGLTAMGPQIRRADELADPLACPRQ